MEQRYNIVRRGTIEVRHESVTQAEAVELCEHLSGFVLQPVELEQGSDEWRVWFKEANSGTKWNPGNAGQSQNLDHLKIQTVRSRIVHRREMGRGSRG